MVPLDVPSNVGVAVPFKTVGAFVPVPPNTVGFIVGHGDVMPDEGASVPLDIRVGDAVPMMVGTTEVPLDIRVGDAVPMMVGTMVLEATLGGAVPMIAEPDVVGIGVDDGLVDGTRVSKDPVTVPSAIVCCPLADTSVRRTCD